jgi:hypothetical protein
MGPNHLITALIYRAVPRKRRLKSRQHLGDTVSTLNPLNQMWHYPGKVDTVSRVMKIHGVHAHRSIVVDRFGLRIDGDERNVPKTFKSGCL